MKKKKKKQHMQGMIRRIFSHNPGVRVKVNTLCHHPETDKGDGRVGRWRGEVGSSDLTMLNSKSFHGTSRARYNLADHIPLQVEHVAVEFVMEPFRPSGHSLRTMRTCA